MLKLKLNKAETRAMKVLLNNAHLMCRCGCIYFGNDASGHAVSVTATDINKGD